MANEKEVSFTVRIKDAGTAALKEIQKTAHKTVEELFSFKEILKGLAGAVTAFSLAELIKDVVDLGTAADKTFRVIAANLPTFTEGIGKLKEELDELGLVSGRTMDELENAAQGIAKAGVSSADELAQVLTAATTLADATGTSVEENAQLLIQMRREFKLTGDEALSTAAKLASVTQGKIGITELMSAFQAATPIFLKFKIDADTGTRALAALVNQGRTTSRAIRDELGKLDAEGIREYASQITIAADAEEQLAQRADHVRNSIEATNQKIKNEFEQTLEEVGTSLLNNLVLPLEKAATALLKLASNNNWAILRALATQDLTGVAKILGDAMYVAHLGSSATPKTLGPLNIQTIGQPLNGPAAPHVMTAEEKKALEDAAKAAAAVNAEFEKLAATTSESAPKSQQFAQAIADWARKALEATDNLDTFNAQLDTLQGVLAKMRNTEALEKQAKAAKDTADAWRGIDDAFARFSNDKIAQFDQEFSNLFATLEEGEQKISDPDQLLDYLDAVDALKAKYRELRQAVVDADGVQKLLNDDLDRLAKLTPGLDQLGKDQKDQKEARRHVLELAQAWDQVGRSVIAAAQAVGGLDDSTAAALQNMVTLGHGVIDLFSGNIGAGIAETVSSLGALMTSSSALAKRVEEDWTRVLDTIAGLALPLSQAQNGNDLGAREAGVRQQFADARAEVEKNFAGKMLEGPRELFLQQLNDLEAKRLELLKAQYEEEQQQLQEDYHIRELRAEGFTTEADALGLAEEQQREYAEAVERGANETTLAALAAAQHAEALKAEADAAHAAAKAALDRAVGTANDNIAIDHVTDPTKIFGIKAAAYQTAGGALGALLGNFDLEHLSADDIAQLDAQFQALFHQLQDPDNTVDLAGLSLEDLQKALKDLDGAAQAVANSVETAADKFNAANAQLSDDFDVYGTSPTDQVTQRAAAYGIDLSQFDLGTPAGVDDAITYLQGLYGAATDPVAKQQYKALIDNLRQIGFPDLGDALGGSGSGRGAGSVGAAGFQSLTTVQGDRLLDINLRHLNADLESRDFLRDIRSVVVSRGTLAPAIAVPTAAGLAAGGAAAGSGQSTGPLVGAINVHVTSAADDAVAQGKAIAREIVREIDVELGRSALGFKSRRGDVSISTVSR